MVQIKLICNSVTECVLMCLFFLMCYSFLCVIDIYSSYALIDPLTDKNGITITNASKKVLDQSDCKPNKIWVEKSSEFYNKPMKS